MESTLLYKLEEKVKNHLLKLFPEHKRLEISCATHMPLRKTREGVIKLTHFSAFKC